LRTVRYYYIDLLVLKYQQIFKEINCTDSTVQYSIYTVCTRINYKTVPVTNSINIYTTVQVELNNMYIDIGVNSGGEKL